MLLFQNFLERLTKQERREDGEERNKLVYSSGGDDVEGKREGYVRQFSISTSCNSKDK